MVVTAIGRLAGSRAANVTVAAQLSADASGAGGILQAFGAGRSEAVATNFAGRVGGLLPTNRILLRDLVVFGGEAREILHNEKLTRDALPSLESGGAVRPVSSATNALIAQPVVAEVVRRIEAAGEVALVYLSANVAGGDEHDPALESAVRRSYPAHRLTEPRR